MARGGGVCIEHADTIATDKLFTGHHRKATTPLTEMTYENMSERLIELLPELRPGYEETMEWWDGDTPGNHVIYGDLLNPYLLSLLEQGGESEALRRIFDFLEVIANHSDSDVRGVLTATVLWRLGGRKDLLPEASKYMGPETLELHHRIESDIAERRRRRES